MRLLLPLFALGVLLSLMAVRPVDSASQYAYFPTADTTDGRFMAIGGGSLQTFPNQAVQLEIGVESNVNRFEIGFFDGDTGGTWDVGDIPVRYQLFTDRQGNGQINGSDRLVATWTGADMPDNDWATFEVETEQAARAQTGNFFYILIADFNLQPGQSDTGVASAFKVRSTGAIGLTRGVIGILVPVYKEAELVIIYPNWLPNFEVEPTTYDGTWDIYFTLTRGLNRFDVLDGDMDHGSPLGCFTTVQNLGIPPDDYSDPAFRRSPCIQYSVITPNGRTFANPMPSANMVWRTFRVECSGRTHCLNPGVYRFHIEGMDAGNLNFLQFSDLVTSVASVTANGKARLLPPNKVISPWFL